MSVREYRERVRVLASLAHLDRENSKLEIVAQLVGYKSKKNFYRAFRQMTGMAPAGFRRLSADERSKIMTASRAVLTWHHRRPFGALG
jgi:methylphosphotriester-DNA--protein-cysteine methyltransferase